MLFKNETETAALPSVNLFLCCENVAGKRCSLSLIYCAAVVCVSGNPAPFCAPTDKPFYSEAGSDRNLTAEFSAHTLLIGLKL